MIELLEAPSGHLVLMLKSSYYEGASVLPWMWAFSTWVCHVRVGGRGSRVIVSSWIQVIFPWLCQKGVLRCQFRDTRRNTSRVFALDVSLFPLAGLSEGLVTGPQAYRKCRYYREIWPLPLENSRFEGVLCGSSIVLSFSVRDEIRPALFPWMWFFSPWLGCPLIVTWF